MELSSRAGAFLGPTDAMPSFSSSSQTPKAMGSSGPINAHSTRCSAAQWAIRWMSVSGQRIQALDRPAIPGDSLAMAANKSSPGVWLNATATACSRPPPPTSKTRILPLVFDLPWFGLHAARLCETPAPGVVVQAAGRFGLLTPLGIPAFWLPARALL